MNRADYKGENGSVKNESFTLCFGTDIFGTYKVNNHLNNGVHQIYTNQ